MKRPSAIRRYKLAARKIKRDRAAGVISTPRHLASGAPLPRQSPSGEWFVFSAPTNGPALFAPSRQIAGPFDSRDEAQQWIDEQ